MVLDNPHFKFWPKGLPHKIKQSQLTLYQNLASSAENYPNRDAVIYYGSVISYRALFESVNSLGNFLYSFSAINPGDRIILYMQNCPQFIISYYAILGVNCIIVPVNPMLAPTELNYIISDSAAKFIITATELLDKVFEAVEKLKMNDVSILVTAYSDLINKKFNVKLPADIKQSSPKKIAEKLYYWLDLSKLKNEKFKHSRRPTDLSVIPYTSGTTGKPKGCEHTNQSVNAVVEAYSRWLPLPDNSKILTSLPLFHVTGMQNSMNVPIFRADTIVLMTRWNVETALYLIQRYKIKSWRSITTSIIDLLSEFNPKHHDLSSLISIGGGGARMPIEMAKKLKEITSLDYIEAYGMTETMAPTHINPSHRPKLGSIGIPIFNVDARIIDLDSGKQLETDCVGELVVSGPQMFLGYWQDKEKTKEAFITLDNKKFLKTGDLGYFDSDGYFYIVDRLKRMISFSGFKVWPAEVEEVLYSHPDIKEACVIAVPDQRTGEKVKAVIVLKEQSAVLTLRRLQIWCKSRMATYKIPKMIELRDELPKNRVGKILWRQVK